MLQLEKSIKRKSTWLCLNRCFHVQRQKILQPLLKNLLHLRYHTSYGASPFYNQGTRQSSSRKEDRARNKSVFLILKFLMQGHSSRLAALDYTVCLHSEVFVTTQGGNFPHFLMGHRRYFYGGHAKTIKPDKRKLALLFDRPDIRYKAVFSFFSFNF